MTEACDIRNHGSSALLSQADPPPFRVLQSGKGGAFLIVCDHAGREVPLSLSRLGLEPAVFDLHVAWDLGAGAVSELVSATLSIPAVLQTYSRLVIDCNRAPGHMDAAPSASDGIEVPGNHGLDEAAVSSRRRAIFEPYHAAIAAELDRFAAKPVLVSIHSFTPTLSGRCRPWEFGVLHDGTSAFSLAVLETLRRDAGLPVGDNEPYSMDETDYTVPHHAGTRGLDYLELEIRQDLIADAAGQARVAALLREVLPESLRRVA